MARQRLSAGAKGAKREKALERQEKYLQKRQNPSSEAIFEGLEEYAENAKPQVDSLSLESAHEIRPCLIGGFHQQNASSPDYFNAVMYQDDSCVSVDMVRLALIFKGDESGEWVKDHALTFPCDDLASYTAKIKPGGWYLLTTYGIGDSSVALGVGHFKPSCKVDMTRGFLEFNPNKVAGDERLAKLICRLRPYVHRADLRRFDIAMDVRKPKRLCCLTKDRRRYECVISNGITEYLGIKNNPGFVKVYDKAAELGLEKGVELTRVELTCDGKWDAEELLEHWPQVHRWTGEFVETCPGKPREWLKPWGMMAEELTALGQSVEQYVLMLDWRQKKIAREKLRADFLELPEGAAGTAIAEAQSWARRFARQ